MPSGCSTSLTTMRLDSLARAVDQHRQAFAGQQQRQQRREHRQLARAVVAGQAPPRRLAGRHAVQPRVGGIEEAGHLLGRLALDAHGQAERADLEVADGAVQQLAEQVDAACSRASGRAPCLPRPISLMYWLIPTG
jgi:hypothetical protein